MYWKTCENTDDIDFMTRYWKPGASTTAENTDTNGLSMSQD